MAVSTSFASRVVPELRIKPKFGPGPGQFIGSGFSYSGLCSIRMFDDRIINRYNYALIKGLNALNPRCEGVSVRISETESKPMASSLSALELLKTSAADSKLNFKI